MRKPAEVLELALTLLDENKGSYFMCLHLEWMDLKGYISPAECSYAQSAVRRSINYMGTLRSYLYERGAVPHHVSSMHPEFRPYQVKFYTDLINKLKQEES